MGKYKDSQTQVSEFSLEGRFLGFLLEDGFKLKRIRVATAEGEQCIKLSKESRAAFVAYNRVLMPGDWIRVSGEKKENLAKGELKLKAYAIAPATPGEETSIQTQAPAEPLLPAKPAAPKPASILVCQKSDCVKRGARGICKALEAALSDRGLDDQVTIKGTGCMKHCKAGPNVVMMPDKTRYSRIHPDEIPALIDKHFPVEAETQPTAGNPEVITPEVAVETEVTLSTPALIS